jgi:hypothetical protein
MPSYNPARCHSGQVAHLLRRVMAACVRPWRITTGGKTRSSPSNKTDIRIHVDRSGRYCREGSRGTEEGKGLAWGVLGISLPLCPDAGNPRRQIRSEYFRLLITHRSRYSSNGVRLAVVWVLSFDDIASPAGSTHPQRAICKEIWR